MDFTTSEKEDIMNWHATDSSSPISFFILTEGAPAPIETCDFA